MILSDADILRAVEGGDITITNFTKKRLQPASYDILLGNKFFLTETHSNKHTDPHRKKYPQVREIVLNKKEHFILHPGISVLSWSEEYFGSNMYLIQLSGKSSLARIGLIVHNTAGIVNPGHFLNITLELYNLSNIPIILRPGMEIAQLTFSMLSSAPSISYSHNVNKYADERKRAKPKRGGKKRVAKQAKRKTSRKSPAKKKIK